MNIENWEISSPVETRVYYVREFMGFDGSLPPDLAGKHPDEPAYIETKQRPKTLRFQSRDSIPIGKPFKFQSITFAIARREGHKYWATEVKR